MNELLIFTKYRDLFYDLAKDASANDQHETAQKYVEKANVLQCIVDDILGVERTLYMATNAGLSSYID